MCSENKIKSENPPRKWMVVKLLYRFSDLSRRVLSSEFQSFSFERTAACKRFVLADTNNSHRLSLRSIIACKKVSRFMFLKLPSTELKACAT